MKNNVVLNIIIAAILLELISALQFFSTQHLLADELERKAETELTMNVVIVKSALNLSENSLWGHLWDMERQLNSPDSLYGVMDNVLQSHPNLIGCWVAFVPDYYPSKGRLFEPYAYWHQGTIKKFVIGDTHDYSQSKYFKRVVSTDNNVWVDPYVDTISGKRMVSYAVPIHDHKKDVVAVFGLDVPTRMLGDTLNYRKIYESSFNMLLTKEGEFIAGPNPKRVNPSDVDYIVSIINDSTVAKRDSKNRRCKIATFRDLDDHEKGYVYYTSFKGKPDWQVAVVCYDDEVFGPLRQMYRTILLTNLAAIIVLGFIISYFIKNNKKLQNTKRAKERIDSELRIASNIQMQMLPKGLTDPSQKGDGSSTNARDDIDIYSFLLPAKEVGGDLFDYYIQDEKLFFCIGDVSGKGVPSAMLMAVTHSWFRAASKHQRNPAIIMQTMNEMSCEGNESSMFVTLFIGILDLPTGHLNYCNAGHDAPILIENGERSPLPVKPNMPIGIFNDVVYEKQDAMLEKGSILFLYTDGLTEAMNKQHQLFGADRMMRLLNSSADLSPQQLVEAMTNEVHVFAEGTEQSDDLTMLAIRYTPKQFESTFQKELTLKNDTRQVPQLNSFIKSVAKQLELDTTQARQLQLGVEEAVVNVMSYAYPPDTKGDITIKALSDGQKLKIQIVDSGVAFDPTETERIDTTLSADERQIGGLGIFLIRELMDTINYERRDGKNILTMEKRVKS